MIVNSKGGPLLETKYNGHHSYFHSHLKVVDEIKRSIESGVFKEKEQLPSEFHLARQFGVSRSVLRKSLQVLEEDNIVTIRPGVGTFVNPKPELSSGIEELNSVTETIESSGKIAGSQYLSIDVVASTEEDRKNFQTNDLETIVKIERIRTADDEPVVFNIDKIPEGLIPLEYIDKEESMFKMMEKYANKRISYAVSYIEPIGYHERIYEILHYNPEQALLLLKQIHFTNENEPVLYSLNYYRPDMFSFHVVRKRE